MWLRYRFSAFWLRSKCSICSYQLNIWYEVHRTSSILNWFLAGDEVSVACYGFVTCRPCIAVPQGFWHTSPIKNIQRQTSIVHVLNESLFAGTWIPTWKTLKEKWPWLRRDLSPPTLSSARQLRIRSRALRLVWRPKKPAYHRTWHQDKLSAKLGCLTDHKSGPSAQNQMHAQLQELQRFRYVYFKFSRFSPIGAIAKTPIKYIYPSNGLKQAFFNTTWEV